MSKSTATKAGLAIIIFVLGNLQAWDSDVPAVGLGIVFLVSLAIALPPVALLVPLKQNYFIGTFILSLALLILARIISQTPLSGLFIVLVPAVTGLIFTGVFKQGGENIEDFKGSDKL